MKVSRFLHLLAAWAVLAGTGTATDLSRVDRTIKKAWKRVAVQAS